MATATPPKQPASAPVRDATKTSVWKALLGGGMTDAAAEDLRSTPKKREAAAGLKKGGKVYKPAKSVKRK